MKKVLLGILFCGTAVVAFGQGSQPQSVKGDGYTPDNAVPEKKASLRAGTSLSKWYNWVDAAETNLGVQFQGYNNMFIFPEPNVVQIYGDGQGGTLMDTVGILGEGQVFDPKAAAFSATDSPLSRFNPYVWDSVAMYTYHYKRFPENPNPDTLIFDFSTTASTSNFTKTAFSGDKTAWITYDAKKNRTAGYKGTFTYLLTDADTGTFKPIIVPVLDGSGNTGLNVPPDGLCAFTISFRPGYSWTPGDTLDYRALTDSSHKLNSLRIYLRRDQSATNDESYNHDLRIIKDVRLDKPANGWKGRYIPGDVWFNSQTQADFNDYLYSFFHITTTHYGLEENGMNGYGISQVYPNPVNGQGTINFKLGKAEKVNITLYNALGQPVQTIADGNYQMGPNSVGVDANSLKPGMYYYTINAGNFVKTMKMNVAR
jgi:hypothetical protein